MTNATGEILQGIMRSLFFFWIVMAAYFAYVGFTLAWYLGVMGLFNLVLAIFLTIISYNLFNEKTKTDRVGARERKNGKGR